MHRRAICPLSGSPPCAVRAWRRRPGHPGRNVRRADRVVRDFLRVTEGLEPATAWTTTRESFRVDLGLNAAWSAGFVRIGRDNVVADIPVDTGRFPLVSAPIPDQGPMGRLERSGRPGSSAEEGRTHAAARPLVLRGSAGTSVTGQAGLRLAGLIQPAWAFTSQRLRVNRSPVIHGSPRRGRQPSRPGRLAVGDTRPTGPRRGGSLPSPRTAREREKPKSRRGTAGIAQRAPERPLLADYRELHEVCGAVLGERIGRREIRWSSRLRPQ